MRVPLPLIRLAVWIRRGLGLFLLALLLTRSSVPVYDRIERIRRFTRPVEFDFLGWTMGAMGVKWTQASLGITDYLPEAERHDLVVGYLEVLAHQAEREARLAELLASPAPAGGEEAERLRREAEADRSREAELGPVIESILQEQASLIVRDLGLAPAGAPFPPVAFRFSRLPLALVVSPREVIRQDANLQISPDLTLDDQIAIESEVERALDVSALVVPVGGIGTYPTMVQQTSGLDFVSEVVAHEWIHNYLTLRPLGLRYDATPELRTMNETAATLLGKEIGRRLIERFYPEIAPPPAQPPAAGPAPTTRLPAFDFRAEMHETRVHADQLLAEGKIEEAEAYLEERRVFLWDHGYRIRRLNQAYFAFYGAYADEPGGPAGEDPVGAAVRALWEGSASPAEFLRTMAWMDDYTDLLAELEKRGIAAP